VKDAVMKCGKMREELMGAVLSGPELANPAVQEHLATCETCALEVASLRQTMELLDEWQAPEPSPYFSARLRARMREEHSQQTVGWLSWLRRPAVLTAAAALLAVGVGMLEGAHVKASRDAEEARKIQHEVTTTSAAVSDLQYLDNHADLFSDFDALDDDQTETN
jgi:anti-sigma factor RsiW